MNALLIGEFDDRVVIRLNRPEVRNAIDRHMIDELHAVCADLEARPQGLPSLRAETVSSPRELASANSANDAEMTRWQVSTQAASIASSACRCRCRPSC